METLPYGLDEQWRPFLAIGFGFAVYFLMWVVWALLLKNLFIKARVIVQLTLVCMGVLSAVLVFFPDKVWVTEVVSVSAIFATILLWSLFDRVFFTYFLARRKKVKVPNILRQIFALLVVLTSVALVMTYGYGVKITGLLATSGVAALILGFAMQDLLSNVIAGFSIHMTKAYKVGDWILLPDSGHRAEVKEVNWRATRLLDTDRVSYELPNSELVKSSIVNLNYPTREHGVRLQVGIDYDQPPNDVKEAFHVAMAGAQGVIESPSPQVFLIDFGDSSIIYELRFWMRSPHLYNQTCDEIRTKLWYELHRRGIRIPFPIRTLEMRTPNVPSRFATADDDAVSILRDHTCMSCLSDDEAARIAAEAPRRIYASGDVLVKESEEGDSMYVVLEGEVGVFLKSQKGGAEKIASLSRGDYFGETSLMTGESRTATVRAAGDVLVMEIGKSLLAPILQDRPELVEALGVMLARRQEELAALHEKNSKSAKDEGEKKEVVSSARLLGRIKSFFGH